MDVLVIAHRAGNSLTALHAAEELAVDVVECDVHRHRGRLEATHLKGAGPLPVLWDRWEVVPIGAPRLALGTLLEARTDRTTLMLDLKGRRPSVARSVRELVRRQERREPVLVCGRWWTSVEVVAEVPFVRPVLSARSSRELGRLLRRLETGPSVHGVSVHLSLLDAGVVSELHRHVALVMTWPVNDLDTLDAALEMGVSGIISDEAVVLSELLARRGR